MAAATTLAHLRLGFAGGLSVWIAGDELCDNRKGEERVIGEETKGRGEPEIRKGVVFHKRKTPMVQHGVLRGTPRGQMGLA